MKKLSCLIGCIFALAAPLCAQTQSHVVGFYNVENLFDTVDDPLINDEEFLPHGPNLWTEDRYKTKLNQISKVIASMNVDIIGLSEIENRKVLEDLVTHPNLAAKRYQIIHFDMTDDRGIDVALLYRPAVFKPFLIKRIPVKDISEPEFKTRDILWVKGLFNKDTLHVAVNHWPSRRGTGKEDKRLLAATSLRSSVDSVMKVNPKAKIVMLGDFNDDPSNRSINKILLSKNQQGDEVLFNTSEATFKKGFGTLAYNGIWNLFDQVIISKELFNGPVRYIPQSFTIYTNFDMQVSSGKNRGFPKRTFVQGNYNPDGFSDHFPVFIVIAKD